MGLTTDDYRRQLQALLPSGMAWPREEDSTLALFLEAAAAEFARIDARASALIYEADPRTTNEMLTDWERVAGLPDNCSGLLPETQWARRSDLVSKLAGRGGQSPAYYKAIAADLGFDIEIKEFRPFRVGASIAGDALTNGDWVFAWRGVAPEVTAIPFRVGRSAVGEALATWGNDALECRIRKYAPAHTIVQFAYGATEPTALLLQSPADTALTFDGDEAVLLETP